MEKALGAGKEAYLDLLENTHDLIQSVSADGRFLYTNRAWRETLGYTEEEVKRLSLLDIIHPDSKSHCMEVFQRVTSGENVSRVEATFVTKDGSKVIVEGNANCKSVGGKPIATLGIFHNTTERKQADEALRKSEEHYRLLTENVADVIWTVDITNNRLTYISPSVTRLLGYSVEEAMARTVEEAFTPASFEIITKNLQEDQAIENMEHKDLYRPRTLELQMNCKDGSMASVELSISLLRAPDGRPTHILSVARDITERKQAEEELRKTHEFLDRILNGIYESVMITTTDYKIMDVNSCFVYFYGVGREEAIGAMCYEITHGLSQPCSESDCTCPLRMVVDTKSPSEVVHIHKDRSGKDVIVQVNSFPILTPTGDIDYVVEVQRDITERQQIEAALQETYQHEKELRQALETEMKKRVEFTRALVHELRTPLTSVMASSELLSAEPLEEPWLSLASNIYRGASNLNNRISELLDLARGELGMLQLEPRPIEPLRMLHSVADDMAPAVSSHKQCLTLDLPDSLPTIWADEDRLRQVMLNLIDNASKFTPEGGNITIKAHLSDNSIVVQVQDTGGGILEDEQARLFEPYHRLQSDRERFSGLGLGLALCKTLVELHEGKIWVESQKGKGSTFSFSIPLKAETLEENTERE